MKTLHTCVCSRNIACIDTVEPYHVEALAPSKEESCSNPHPLHPFPHPPPFLLFVNFFGHEVMNIFLKLLKYMYVYITCSQRQYCWIMKCSSFLYETSNVETVRCFEWKYSSGNSTNSYVHSGVPNRMPSLSLSLFFFFFRCKLFVPALTWCWLASIYLMLTC